MELLLCTVLYQHLDVLWESDIKDLATNDASMVACTTNGVDAAHDGVRRKVWVCVGCWRNARKVKRLAVGEGVVVFEQQVGTAQFLALYPRLGE